MAIKLDIYASFKPRKNERAQSLVELAVSLTVMLMLLLGAIEISLALFQYVTIRDAAQEGATYGSINPADETGIKLHTLSAANDVLILTEDDVTVDILDPLQPCEYSSIVAGITVPNSISVEVKYLHNIAFPIPMLNTNAITLTARATNTILYPSCTPP
jgi:hypothetical protein